MSRQKAQLASDRCIRLLALVATEFGDEEVAAIRLEARERMGFATWRSTLLGVAIVTRERHPEFWRVAVEGTEW